MPAMKNQGKNGPEWLLKGSEPDLNGGVRALFFGGTAENSTFAPKQTK